MGNSKSQPQQIVTVPSSRRQRNASKRAANKDRVKNNRRKKIFAKRGIQKDQHSNARRDQKNRGNNDLLKLESAARSKNGRDREKSEPTSRTSSEEGNGIQLNDRKLNLTPSRDGIATVATTPASFDRLSVSSRSSDTRIRRTPTSSPTPIQSQTKTPPSTPPSPQTKSSDYVLFLPEPTTLFPSNAERLVSNNTLFQQNEDSRGEDCEFPTRNVIADIMGEGDADELSLSDLDDNENDDDKDGNSSEVSDSMLSNGSCCEFSDYNLDDDGVNTQSRSIASSVSARRQGLGLSSLSVRSMKSTSSFIGGRSTCTTRTQRKKLPKPTAMNAFETLPHHLIKRSLIRQAASTLRDERFIARRIKKLGAVYASQVHVLDFTTLHDKMWADAERIEMENTMEHAPMPSMATLAEGEDLDQVTFESFDLFENCIMELCAIQTVKTDPDQGGGNEFANDTEDIEIRQCLSAEMDEKSMDKYQNLEVRNCISEEEAVETTIGREPQIPLDEAGRALYTLGKFCQKSGWNNDAIHYYRHALYLLFLDVGLEEVRLLDNTDDCDGFFYVQASRDVEMYSSVTNQYLSTIFFKLGDIHGQKDEKNNALHAYRASQEFGKKFLRYIGDNSSNEDEVVAAVENLALSYNRIGAVYTSKGDLESALASLHEALEIQVQTLGEEHIEVAKTLHNIGVCHRHRGMWGGALEFYQHAHRIFALNLGRDHLDTVRTLHNIGGVYRRQKQYSEAMECFEEVLEVRRRILGEDHPSVAITYVSMAAVHRRAGRKKEANKLYTLALK